MHHFWIVSLAPFDETSHLASTVDRPSSLYLVVSHFYRGQDGGWEALFGCEFEDSAGALLWLCPCRINMHMLPHVIRQYPPGTKCWLNVTMTLNDINQCYSNINQCYYNVKSTLFACWVDYLGLLGYPMTNNVKITRMIYLWEWLSGATCQLPKVGLTGRLQAWVLLSLYTF